MANIEDVAKKAGVSIATVSRVFNRRGNVVERTIKKVLKAADELDYNPKLTARRDSIALVVQNLDWMTFGGYNAMIVPTLIKQVIESGYRIEVVKTNELATLRDKFVCGVISLIYSDRLLPRLEDARRLPVVTVNSVFPGMPSVVSNDRQGIKDAVEHLVSLGHRRIGFRGGSAGTYNGANRLESFIETVKELGLNIDECPFQEGKGNQTEQMALLLRSNPTAVIVDGEASGPSVSYSLGLLGRRIPQDLSLISFEYPGVSNYFTPPHTTIGQDVEGLAREAMRLVHEMESGDLARDDETRIEVDYNMTVRESTAPPANQ